MVSLVLMGVGSTLIGAIPNYDSIGFWAPVLLVALRIIQGIGLGGEGAGATLMSMEHAPAGKRNLYAGFPQMGTPAGLVLANVIFLVTNALLGDGAFTSWGWRIPFLLSFVLVAVGLLIRLRVTESPSFNRVLAQENVVRFPLLESLKVGFPGWRSPCSPWSRTPPSPMCSWCSRCPTEPNSSATTSSSSS